MVKSAKGQTMTDISNTEYITITKDGVFVGGKPATEYHGYMIYFLDISRAGLVQIQKQNPEVQELHIGAFETAGFFAKKGNPSKVFGRNAWVRVKMSDGRLGPWVFQNTYASTTDCAKNCAYNCAYLVRSRPDMCSAMLNFTEDKETNTENKKTAQSKEPLREQHKIISAFKIGCFKITIERIKQR